jgi:hypothetical protein
LHLRGTEWVSPYPRSSLESQSKNRHIFFPSRHEVSPKFLRKTPKIRMSYPSVKVGPSEILPELLHSIERTNVVGLFVSSQEEMITTSVLKVSGDEKQTYVYLQDHDLHGYPIEKNPILLSEIQKVIPFRTLFNDPVYVNIRQMAKNQKDDLAA